jgi:hypothetical protein
VNRRPGRPGAVFAPVDPLPTAEELCADGSLSVAAAAKFLSVSLRQMKKLVASDDVPSFKLGRRRLVPRRGLVLLQAKLLAAQQPGMTRLSGG